MTAGTQIIDVTDAAGRLVEPEWLARAERVHRQLRSALPAAYAPKMQRVFEGGGRMCVAARGREVEGLALYRIYENTFSGVRLYVDDLVTDEARRSTGVGKALLGHIEALARTSGCDDLALDSGTQRTQAHKFYYREGMAASSFHFTKRLS